MYFKDKSKYSYDLPFEINEVENIGWLDKGMDFDVGNVSPDFINKLAQIIEREEVNVMRGIDYCNLCNDYLEKYLTIGDKNILLGISEIWVNSADNSIIFASPTLIYHYITVHRYEPPKEFIDSVNSFSLSSDWSGQIQFENLKTKYFRSFTRY